MIIIRICSRRHLAGFCPAADGSQQRLEELENLRHVILVGPDETAYEQVEEKLKDRVTFLSREHLQVMNDEERTDFSGITVSEVCNWREIGRSAGRCCEILFHYIYLLIKMCFVQRMHRRHGVRGI